MLLSEGKLRAKRKKPRNSPLMAEQKPDNSPFNISPELLKNLPQNTQVAVAQSITFKGPLPPPALYREYEEILPGMAERLMKMAESEQSHRHDWEKRITSYSAKEIIRGQWMGLVLALCAFAAAIGCVYWGYPWVAIVFGGASLASILTAFFKKSKDE